ncbi:glutathione S-transferase-like [Metopolophium dirhodum]|uniref:glutathione S-transferase-like n=1 Tax=Metopolophium dirhodum TaxID=44670 RepID=UPI00298FFC28|nr:glutathione S-transferase-like [Metopolophium dirhodum]XP_060861257.1 glutathione S-transferase-like [Metopolophium dirhodum]XP_060861258.1 glutathione S-transferase-like [Metopolophium dirhodum]
MTTYKLTYFNLTARAEQIRFLLSYLNVDFQDVRFEREQWPAIKPTMPFGKVPVLEIDGKTFNQSIAICRYLAKKAGLAGDDEWESLLVDVAVDNIYEIRQEIMNYYHEPNEEIKSKLRDPIVNDSIPFYFDKFEKIVSENGGYFVNGKLSWPDLYFVSILDHIKSVIDVDLVDGRPHLTALKHKVLAIPQIKSWIAKRPKSQ